jgi:hypothetical protein
MLKTRALRVVAAGAVLVGGALLAGAAPAAATAPASLQGEFLTDTIGANIDEASYVCDPAGTSTITFVHSSPVTSGPYPGTLTDRVTVTLGPSEPHDLGFAVVERSPILSLEGTFEITGPNGTVTGTTYMTEAQAGDANYGGCWESSPAAQIIASDLTYDATLPGDWTDSGATWINGNAYGDPSTGGQGTNNYRHGFPTSYGVTAPGSGVSDVDEDGVADANDNCVDVANAAQTDTDGDGIGDACDTTPNGDRDADGVDDGSDNCVNVANSAQTDSDGDGLGDACDTTPNGDVDHDGIDNHADNCVDVANAAQTDTDGDGIGDACDPTPNGDRDSDGVDNNADNCVDVANSAQVDTDHDGIGDACDRTPNGENPPADSAACKDGGWRTHTDATGRPFKNQGDCVSYVATGGKNQPNG